MDEKKIQTGGRNGFVLVFQFSGAVIGWTLHAPKFKPLKLTFRFTFCKDRKDMKGQVANAVAIWNKLCSSYILLRDELRTFRHPSNSVGSIKSLLEIDRKSRDAFYSKALEFSPFFSHEKSNIDKMISSDDKFVSPSTIGKIDTWWR